MIRTALLTIAVVLGFSIFVGIYAQTPSLNEQARGAGLTHVETLDTSDVRIVSRVRAWAGDCPVIIERHKRQDGDIYVVKANSSTEAANNEGHIGLYIGQPFPGGDLIQERLMHGKTAAARGVTGYDDNGHVLPPYLCDAREPYDN